MFCTDIWYKGTIALEINTSESNTDNIIYATSRNKFNHKKWQLFNHWGHKWIFKIIMLFYACNGIILENIKPFHFLLKCCWTIIRYVWLFCQCIHTIFPLFHIWWKNGLLVIESIKETKLSWNDWNKYPSEQWCIYIIP